MNKITDVVIIGAGPAGYTAAIYAARASLSVKIICGSSPGGQLLLTSEVENFPGFRDGILGPELMEEMKEQAKRFGVEIIQEFVTKVELGGQPKKIWVGQDEYLAKSVVIATGASANWLGLKNEQRLIGKGVSACATCDGFFFEGKDVVVVGGGDSAMEESLTLAKFVNKVTIVHRRDEFRASKIMRDRVLNHSRITIQWNKIVEDVLGDEVVEGVRLQDTENGKSSELECQGLFVAVGHTPATELFKHSLLIDKKGYLVVRDNVKTALPGVFAAGDVADPRYRQAITAAGDGCRAALEAEHFIANL